MIVISIENLIVIIIIMVFNLYVLTTTTKTVAKYVHYFNGYIISVGQRERVKKELVEF